MLIWTAGASSIAFLVTNEEVRATANMLLPFVAILPLLGTPAWLLDGIFIGAAGGEVAEMLRRHDCGVTVDPEDAVALVVAIEGLTSQAEARRRLGANALKGSTSFNLAKAFPSWKGLLLNSERAPQRIAR